MVYADPNFVSGMGGQFGKQDEDVSSSPAVHRRSMEVRSLPLILCGNKYSVPRHSKIHPGSHVIFKPSIHHGSKSHVSTSEAASLIEIASHEKRSTWQAGVVTAVDPADSETVQVCSLCRGDSGGISQSVSYEHEVRTDEIRFERTRAPVFGLSLERRGENQMRFVFTTSSVDVEQRSKLGFRVQGKPGTLFSDLEGFVEGSSISIEKNIKLKIYD